MSPKRGTYGRRVPDYMAPMFWADAVETNIDRLRRYAAFSCGDVHTGDNVVYEALQDVLKDVSSAEPANMVTLFEHLDLNLRQHPQGHADRFADFGRWQFLKPLERRIVLLMVLEGFSCQQAAQVTGISFPEAKSLLGRAKMKYADRFPARIGLVGADGDTKETVAKALDSYGYRLVWSLGKDTPAVRDQLEAPSAVLVIGQPDCATMPDGTDRNALSGRYGSYGVRGASLEDFGGPVIVANGTPRADRISSQVWNMPLADLSDAGRLRGTLVRALLFSS